MYQSKVYIEFHHHNNELLMLLLFKVGLIKLGAEV